MKTLVIQMHDPLHTRLKNVCTSNDESMTKYVTRLIRDDFRRQEGKEIQLNINGYRK